VAYIQNHDQLGNRARGERVCHLVNLDRVRIGAALVLLAPYVPLLFQGEEWAASAPFQYFVDFHTEPTLAVAVREGRSREFAAFGWDPAQVPDPTDPATFERSRIDWSELDRPQQRELCEWYRELIQLRRQVWALTTGRLDYTSADCDAQHEWLRVERGPITIACNFAREARDVPIAADEHDVVFLASKPGWKRTASTLALPAESVVVLGPAWEREQS
jgi:maltooligosyltrehalose trehalohydrolase